MFCCFSRVRFLGRAVFCIPNVSLALPFTTVYEIACAFFLIRFCICYIHLVFQKCLEVLVKYFAAVHEVPCPCGCRYCHNGNCSPAHSQLHTVHGFMKNICCPPQVTLTETFCMLVRKHTCTCVPHCLFVFNWSYPKVVFPASTAHFYKWDCLKVNGSCTECWTNKPGNCVLCPRAKLWEQGNTELCWEEYKKTDINLANLNAPGAIPQTFTFAGTYKHSSKQ